MAGDNRKFTPGRGGEARGNRRVWRFARTDGECLAGCKILVQPIADRRIILDDQDGTRDGAILPPPLRTTQSPERGAGAATAGDGARPSQAAPRIGSARPAACYRRLLLRPRQAASQPPNDGRRRRPGGVIVRDVVPAIVARLAKSVAFARIMCGVAGGCTSRSTGVRVPGAGIGRTRARIRRSTVPLSVISRWSAVRRGTATMSAPVIARAGCTAGAAAMASAGALGAMIAAAASTTAVAATTVAAATAVAAAAVAAATVAATTAVTAATAAVTAAATVAAAAVAAATAVTAATAAVAAAAVAATTVAATTVAAATAAAVTTATAAAVAAATAAATAAVAVVSMGGLQLQSAVGGIEAPRRCGHRQSASTQGKSEQCRRPPPRQRAAVSGASPSGMSFRRL